MLGTITAFIIERFEFRGKKFVVGLFFLGMLIPSFVTEISRFRIINGFHLYNTLGAPIVIYIASDLMQLYIYRQFISGLSVSLDEAALLDGCSYFQLFYKIIFPLLAPATATGMYREGHQHHQRHVHPFICICRRTSCVPSLHF